MADRGTGVINPVIPDPDIVGLDYSFNWPGYNYGTGTLLSPTKVAGGPGGYVMDLVVGVPPRPGSVGVTGIVEYLALGNPYTPEGAARGAGPLVVIALPGGRSVQVPL